MNVHRLDGCSPTPLASYLKALGILRIVGEQLDPGARAWWEGERFLLASKVDADEIQSFFLGQYSPAPVVAPWNKGSGFYYENDPALTAIESSVAPRFERLREGVRAARILLGALTAADERVRNVKVQAKDRSLTQTQRNELRESPEYKARLATAERDFKALKGGLLPDLKVVWRGPHRQWLDAAVVLDEDGVARFPALLGTGGNDGRLDFTNNFFQRLCELFDFSDDCGRARPLSSAWFLDALCATPAPGVRKGIAVGQFSPVGAGGANASTGPVADPQLNPVDFVLALEGTMLFAATVTKRTETKRPSRASAPFVLPAQAAGYAGAATADEGARGEQWMPLWDRPMTIIELRHLLSEGRAQMGTGSANSPLQFARCASRLGTSRGIRAFLRFGYMERNGQSNFAVPLGRFETTGRSTGSHDCIDDLDTWLQRVRRSARAKNAPATLVRAERQLADALFAVVQQPDLAARWQAVLLRLGDVEAVQRRGGGFDAGPIPPLRPDWVRAADDGSAEFRLAVACALQGGERRSDGRVIDGVRRHWLTLDSGRFKTSGDVGQRRLVNETDRVFAGRRAVDDLGALVERRLIEGAKDGGRRVPLAAANLATSSLGDLGRLLRGELDVERIGAMLPALMAIDARRWSATPVRLPASAGEGPDDAWIAIRLALSTEPLADGRTIGADPAILRRLACGDAPEAVRLALRRLRAAGVRATIRAGSVPPEAARRWAAALAFPVSRTVAAQLQRRLDPNSLQENAR